MTVVINNTSEKSDKVLEEEMVEAKKTKDKAKASNFVGLDIGTSFVVSAFSKGDKVATNILRSAFLELPPDTRTRKMLENLKHSYIETDDALYLVGEPAVGLANLFSSEVKRPMSKGVLSPKEQDAIKVMRLLIKEVLKDLVAPGTVVAYSSPADPVDGSFSTLYHQSLMKDILETDLGCTALALNEAHALGYAELSDDMYTGLCFSFGAGMVNAVLSYAGIDALKFSIPKGGDWIDHNAALSRGITASQMQVKKEEGTNLMSPSTPDEQATAIYYRALISEAVDSFNNRFKNAQDKPQLTTPIPVILAGGTSKANGFLELFKSIVEEKGFPFEIKEIRPAKEPLRAVAEGLLMAAINSADE